MIELLVTAARNLPAALALLGVAAALAGLLLYRLALKARARAQARAGATTSGPPPATLDLTGHPSSLELRRDFVSGRRALRLAGPDRAASYAHPRILRLGRDVPGDRPLLEHAGLALPYGQPRRTASAQAPGVEWWALSEGLVLDVVGADRASGEGGWHDVLEQLRRARSARPVDGAVVTVPASALTGAGMPMARRLAEAAREGFAIQDRLAQAQRTLGMQFPVYVLVTHCEHIPGFAALAGAVAASQRQTMLGWSNPAPPTSAFSPAWVGRALDSVHEELEAFQLRHLARVAGEGPGDEHAVAFPSRLMELREPLQVFAVQLFGAWPGDEPPVFRGLYFCGAAAAAADPHAAASPPPRNGATEAVFVGDLLERKVFAEAGLAQPTARRMARAGRLRTALAAVTLAALAWVGAQLWRAPAPVEARVSQLAPAMERIASAIARADAANDSGLARRAASLEPTARELLDTASGVQGFRLRTALLPSSWLSPLPARVEQSVRAGFDRVVFPAMRSVLATRTDALASRTLPPAAPRDASVADARSDPALRALERYTRDLSDLEALIARYQRVASRGAIPPAQVLAEFNALANELLGRTLRPRAAAADTYARVLQASATTPFDYRQHDFDARIRDHVLALVQRLDAALFESNPVVAALTAANADLDGHWPLRAPADAEAYRRLYRRLSGAARDLERPQVQWMFADRLDLGPGFDEALRRIHESSFLGPAIAREIKARVLDGFAGLRARIDALDAGRLGSPIVVTEGRARLTPEAEETLQTLRLVLQQPFMREDRPAAILREDWPASTVLTWNAAPLAEAVDVFGAWQGFPADVDALLERAELTELPAPLRDSEGRVTRDGLALRLRTLIAEAQSFSPLPDVYAPGILEEIVAGQVQNLSALAGTLDRVRDALRRLGLEDDEAKLARVLHRQRLAILARVSSLLSHYAPYRSVEPGFAWWDGEQPPAQRAFGVAGADQLADYLDRQREIVAHLADSYATPVLTLLAKEGAAPIGAAAPDVTRWQRISADLADHANKVAGNAVAALESLIATRLGEVVLATCFDPASPDATPGSGGGFFRARRESLSRQLLDRCRALADEQGYARYVAIARRFNRDLAGSFPFAPAAMAAAASPAAIRDFFDADFEQALTLIRRVPDPSERFGDRRDEALAFMERMDAVRGFFARFLSPDATSDRPVFDLDVRFRVLRHVEEGADQVIRWRLDVGGQRVDLLSSGSTADPGEEKERTPAARWVYGMPVSLGVDWASGSAYSPVAAAPAERAHVHGKSLRFDYPDPWSLIRLLVDHRPPASDFPALRDLQPETLRLSVLTATDAEPSEERMARLYLRIVLLDPDGGKAVELPDFPAFAAPPERATRAAPGATPPEPAARAAGGDRAPAARAAPG